MNQLFTRYTEIGDRDGNSLQNKQVLCPLFFDSVKGIVNLGSIYGDLIISLKQEVVILYELHR